MRPWRQIGFLAGTGVLLCLLLGRLAAQSPEPPPVQVVPFQGRNGVRAQVDVQVRYDSTADRFTYVYDLLSLNTSTQPLFEFNIGTSAPLDNTIVPDPYSGAHLTDSSAGTPDTFGVCPNSDLALDWTPLMLKPGQSLRGITLVTQGPPQVGLTYTMGDVPPLSVDKVMGAPPPGYSAEWEDDCTRNDTVTPALPRDFALGEHLEFLRAQVAKAAALGWIRPESQVEALVGRAAGEATSGQIEAVRTTLQQLKAALESSRGSGVTNEGYYLVAANADYVLDQLPRPSQPLTVSVQVLSKHVKPRKGELARISVACSRYPVSLQFTVRRGSIAVYQASVSNQASTYQFVWDGRTSSGQPAANGNHSIEIKATDGSGAQALGSADVQVNNNQ